MIVTGFVVLLMWNLIVCIQDMKFKELYPSTQWRFSDTAFYLFQQPSTALEVCTVICAQNPVCRAVFIDQDVCFGISTLMSASSMHSKVRTFVKQPSNECVGSDFVYYDGLCVMGSSVKLNWYEARTYCENKDSHLLVLDSQHKLNSAKEFLQTYYRHSDLYVGASDGSTDGEWKWDSKTTASDFFYWRIGQPNNDDTEYPNKTANCGAVYPNYNMELQDEYCYQEKRFICEM